MEKKIIKNNSKNNTKKKTSLPLLLGAIVFLALVVVLIAVSKNGSLKKNEDNTTVLSQTREQTASQSVSPAKDDPEKDQETASPDTKEVTVIEEGGSLVIPVSEISDTAVFYPVEVDGVRMEILAVYDSEGNIRTAFNTCQICYGSGRGYYVQKGNVLVCQNCGNRFTVDDVEVESGGCNPWPIFAENKTITADAIEISYDFLLESKEIFTNWKSGF